MIDAFAAADHPARSKKKVQQVHTALNRLKNSAVDDDASRHVGRVLTGLAGAILDNAASSGYGQVLPTAPVDDRAPIPELVSLHVERYIPHEKLGPRLHLLSLPTQQRWLDKINAGEVELTQLGLETVEQALSFVRKFGRKVRVLDLRPYGNAVTDADIKQLAGTCPRLRKLTVRSSGLTDKIAPDLAKFSQLRALALHCAWNLTDAIGADLAVLRRLESLDLSWCSKITSGIGPSLQKMTQLQRLDLSFCFAVNDCIGRYLVSLDRLRILSLCGCERVTNALGPYLSQMPQLKELDLHGCTRLTAWIGPYLAGMTGLTSLILCGCSRISDEIAPHLAMLTNLRRLDAAFMPLSDEVGPHLAKLTNLEHLDVSSCPQITAAINPHLAHIDTVKR